MEFYSVRFHVYLNKNLDYLIIQHVPCVEHICNESKNQIEDWRIELLEKMIPKNSVCSKLRRWFLGTRILSWKHPVTRWCLKSTKAIEYEIKQQLQFHPQMFHPFGSFRLFWETVMTLFTVVALLIMPVLLAFHFGEQKKWYFLYQAIDIVFICDIVIWFFTGYYDYCTQLIILDAKVVASKYLRGFFVIDVLSALPFNFLTVISESVWYFTSLNVLKILRIRNVLVYYHRLSYVYRMNFHFYKLMEIAIVVVLSVHWAACLEYYLPLFVAEITNKQDNASWIRSSYMAGRQTKVEIYITCINRAVISLTGSAHYLDMKAPEDIIFNLILTIFGFLGFIYLLARFSQLASIFRSTDQKHWKLMQQLRQYMRHKELPHSLQRRLLAYFHYRNKKGFERHERIINHVSPYLREQILLHDYSKLLDNVELFGYLPRIAVTQLASVLRSEIFMTNDILVKAGTRGDGLFFIASGTVAVYNTVGKEICHLEDGAYFGEIALLIEDEHRIATVVALENCEVYILSRYDFQRIVMPYPDLLTYLQNIALVRLEQTQLFEDMESSVTPGKINVSSVKHNRRD